jgi:hypothetical protein
MEGCGGTLPRAEEWEPHDADTFASELLSKGLSLAKVAALLGDRQ